VLYLLRVSVPDRPGTLGALATAIGEAGGDITAVDVVERSPTAAVDDVLVETADAASAGAIVTKLESVPGFVIEAWQPFTEGDQLRDGLDIVDGLGSTASRALAAITRVAPAVLRARWVVIIDDVNGGVAITHASAGAPWVRWAALPWLPLATAGSVDADPSWLPHEWGGDPQLAAAPVGDSRMVLLAVRPNGPRFRDAETAKLANLAAIAALAAHSTPPSGISGRAPAPARG
jgi:ACT domain-containing protein